MSAGAPARALVRALTWGLCWGVATGALEAVWHLSSWNLPTTWATASGFFARAVVYGALFHGGWQLLWMGAALVAPPVRARLLAAGQPTIDASAVGILVAGTVTLHGVVTWRVGYHINDPWSSPALLGGIAAALLGALLLGIAAGWLARGALARLGWVRIVPLPLGLALYLAVPLGLPGTAASETPLRVLLITLDTFRADRVGALGGPVDTPTLDALAARGVLFELAVAQAPITCPSHLSILSGTSPATHGVFANGTAIPTDLPVLAEIFADRGVPTAGFVAGYPVTRRFGFDRGFGVFDDDFGAALGDHRLTVRRLVDQFLYARGAPRERRGDRVLSRAIPWLDQHADTGFFVWVHLFDAHGPYDAPAPFGGSLAGGLPGATEGPEMPHYWPADHQAAADPAYWIQRYDEEIAYIDAQLGRLLDRLADAGVLEDTLVAVVADHGESLGEHDYYFDHGLHLYDASLRIPMLLAGPGIEAPARIPCQVRGMDLAPTVLDLAGLTTPASMEGESLQPLWTDGCPESGLRFSLAATVEPPWLPEPGAELALRSDGDARFKLVRHRRSAAELYDLIADPGEEDDIAGVRLDIADWLSESLDEITSGMVTEAPELTPEVEAQLRALGYITDGPRAPTGDDDSAGRPGDR